MIDFFQKALDKALSERVSVAQGFDTAILSKAISFFQLERPAPQLVVVAGSNGKGTCAHVLSSWLEIRGYRVGLMTSPHIFNYKERYLFNNQQLPVSI